MTPGFVNRSLIVSSGSSYRVLVHSRSVDTGRLASSVPKTSFSTLAVIRPLASMPAGLSPYSPRLSSPYFSKSSRRPIFHNQTSGGCDHKPPAEPAVKFFSRSTVVLIRCVRFQTRLNFGLSVALFRPPSFGGYQTLQLSSPSTSLSYIPSSIPSSFLLRTLSWPLLLPFLAPLQIPPLIT